jgi:ubiquinone/menaquinone biosynthesis C-methylase UbiE
MIVDYLMEGPEEAIRLDMKTDPEQVKKQALWAGIRPGMRVADLGCGSGKTTSILHELVQPMGTVVGVDFAEKRIEYAVEHYSAEGMEFLCRDIRKPLDDLGQFDFVWIRFVLEYYRSTNFEIIENTSRVVKPDGILCLIDLDYNCLSHFGLSQRLEKTIFEFVKILEEETNFDPYAGRKLYSYLYRLGYHGLNVDVAAHHTIYGELGDVDDFNWAKKIEAIKTISKKVDFMFREYPGGFEELKEECNRFFRDPARFSYTPIICVSGLKTRP